MARIRDSVGREVGSIFTRMFNDAQLGLLISKLQATSIRNGNELEKLIVKNSQTIDDLDVFIKRFQKMSYKIYLCPPKTLKQSKFANGQEPDILVFIVGDTYACKVIELKDGDSFDTKKSLRSAIEEYFHFYNHKRFQERFKTRTPIEVRTEALNSSNPALYPIPENKRIQKYKAKFAA